MIAEAGAAISGIKVALDIAKGMAALKSEAEINQAIIEIQRNLLEAQSAAFDDKQSIARLNDEKAKLERILQDNNKWEIERTRYGLVQADLGNYFYELRPEFVDGQARHRLCVTCFENKRKSILQGIPEATCFTCGMSIRLTRSGYPQRAKKL